MPKITSQDGTTIAYDKKGQGPVLILVLGALNRRSQGKKLAELLSDRFTVISYDRRGRGDSTDTQPYNTDKEAGDIEALIDELGGNAYLYGQNWVIKLRAWHFMNCLIIQILRHKVNPKPTGKS
jgi:pimeloyl-ACP methyl ester carboxylesterase